MDGYGGGGGHYSKCTQQVSFREPGRMDGQRENSIPAHKHSMRGGIITWMSGQNVATVRLRVNALDF